VSYNEDEAALAEQVADLRAEGDELYEVLQSLDAADWSRTTTFKDWTVYDVLAHLHISDHLAITTLNSAEDLEALLHDVQSSDLPMVAYTRQWLGDVTGPELLDRWRNLFAEMSERLAAADPEQRLAWAGPPMKPRMFTTARQMETWAHGWEIYDLLGLTRKHSDRIYNIATIGVRTFGWTFANRQLPVSSEIPYIRLSAPSGAIWEWNDPGSSNSVVGDAVAFCQVVTQVRNIADTDLVVTGEIAGQWMAMAQCFAGPPEDPPATGSRVVAPLGGGNRTQLQRL
jgi:uncharacterized protein (TIGR03084 family)